MKHPLATLSLIVACASPAPLARADEVVASTQLTLRDAVSRALDGSYSARIAALERGRVEDELAASEGAYWPQLSASAQAGYSNRQNERFTALDENLIPRQYGLSNLANDPWFSVVVDQVLLDLRRWRELERDELMAKVAVIRERAGAERVAFEVARRYAALLRAHSFAEIGRERLDAAAWLDEQALRLEGAGRVLEGERLQAQIEREEARMQLLAAEMAVASARSALWLAIDDSPEPEAWPELVSASFPELGVDAAWVAGEGLDERLLRTPDLQILDLRRRIEEASVSAARAGRYPSLQLRGGYSHYGIKRFDNFEDEAFVFVGVEMPLFDGFQNASRVAAARKAASVARLEHRSALGSKRVRVLDLQRRLELAEGRTELVERRVDAARAAQQLADHRLQALRGGVAEAQRARETVRRELSLAADLRFERVELWATLQREMGLLAASLGGEAGRTSTDSLP
jgi:outer membrane protein TolC